MTKKDYVKLARALKKAKDTQRLFPHTDVWACCVRYITEELRYDNPRFDKGKFLTACGYEEEV